MNQLIQKRHPHCPRFFLWLIGVTHNDLVKITTQYKLYLSDLAVPIQASLLKPQDIFG